MNQVTMLDLAAERAALGSAVADAVSDVLASGRYVLGPVVEGFERDFASFQRAPHAVGVASGTAALELALEAAGVCVGDAVLTSPFTFFASAAVIARRGARVVLADIDPETALITPETARAALAASGPVKCLLPVHLYGQLVDVEGFRSLADELGASLIEDAAQAHGAERDGRRAGELGDMACFSFYPTKNLGCAGEGGLVTALTDELDGRLRRLRDHGSGAKYVHEDLGTNSRLHSIQAAVLATKLPHLEGWNARRREVAEAYDQGLDDAPGVQALHKAAGSVHHQYAVRVTGGGGREEAAAILAERGIQSAVHYPRPVHLQPAAASWGYGEGSLPEAEKLAREVLCLPIHPFLGEEDVKRVVAALREL